METFGEIIPFAKELLNQKPKWGMVKIYTLGSTLAMLGVVGALVEAVFLPFAEQETVEDAPVELIKSRTTFVHLEVVDVLKTVAIKAKDKHLVSAGLRNSANRLHAS